MGGKRLKYDSGFQLNKCAKKRCHSDVDRISDLPDDVLVTIVSFLSLKEAARTSVLSSRWINLWKNTHSLNFDAAYKESALIEILDGEAEQELLDQERHKYVEWVNSILKSHKAVSLKEFTISFDLCRSTSEVITQWLEFALVRRVQSLEMDLSPSPIHLRSNNYAFPEEWLTRSSGGASILKPPSDSSCIDFRSLKALSLKCVNVTREAIEFFLRNCVLLEKLVVHGAHEISSLEVYGSSLALKHLELCSCRKLQSVKVSAPNLTSLTLPNVPKLLLENIPMLNEVSVNCAYTPDYVNKLLGAFSCRIFQLETLTLQLPFNPELGMLLSKFPQLPKLKKLIIKYMATDKGSYIGLTPLMRACPNLQEFVLKLMWSKPSRLRRKLKSSMKFPHEHLKVFEFSCYYGSTSDVEFVRYIVVNCIALEKIIIDPHFPYTFPRVSRHPAILDLEQTARINARQQLETLVPPHIDLVIR